MTYSKGHKPQTHSGNEGSMLGFVVWGEVRQRDDRVALYSKRIWNKNHEVAHSLGVEGESIMERGHIGMTLHSVDPWEGGNNCLHTGEVRNIVIRVMSVRRCHGNLGIYLYLIVSIHWEWCSARSWDLLYAEYASVCWAAPVKLSQATVTKGSWPISLTTSRCRIS